MSNFIHNFPPKKLRCQTCSRPSFMYRNYSRDYTSKQTYEGEDIWHRMHYQCERKHCDAQCELEYRCKTFDKDFTQPTPYSNWSEINVKNF